MVLNWQIGKSVKDMHLVGRYRYRIGGSVMER